MPRRKKKGAIKVKEKRVNKSDVDAVVEDRVDGAPMLRCAENRISQSMEEHGKKKQTKQERLEKKRLAEKRRLERIRSDPERYADFKAKQRESYHKRKAAKKILPISEMSDKNKRIVRKRNRDNFRAYYQRKKQRKRLEVLLEENSPPDSEEEHQADAMGNIPDSSLPRISRSNSPMAGPSSCYKDLGDPKGSISASSSLITPNRMRTRYISPIQSPQSPCSSVSTIASSSVHKLALRKYKYKRDREVAALQLKLREITSSREIYRKRCERLKKKICAPSDNNVQILKSKSRLKRKTIKLSKVINIVKKDVEIFFEEDENSRVCPGKKEFITKGKEKKQKRYLNDSLINLHNKYKQIRTNTNISYSTFCRFRPFWVKIPDYKARDTCLCQPHANMRLLIDALKRRNIIAESSCTEVIKSVTCNHEYLECLQRKCPRCVMRYLQFKEFDDSQPISYWRWQKRTKIYFHDGIEKKSLITEKTKIQTSPREALREFDKILKPFLHHCANMINQYAAVKYIKEHLSKEECILHCDYSENYMTKFAEEVQSLHFGGSKQQITLHTAVIYYFDPIDNAKYKTQSYCTLSENNRHDAAAVWAHLIPLLRFIQEKAPQVKILHLVSDSPSSQYRNKKVFYLISKLYWYFDNLEKVTWNYSESGHGKGAPDGVGGVLKRTADQMVAYGQDIANIQIFMKHLHERVPGVLLEVVNDYDISEKDLLMQTGVIKPFSGTMKTHQVVWNKELGSQLTMRSLTCTNPGCLFNAKYCHHGHHIGFHKVEQDSSVYVVNRIIPGYIPEEETSRNRDENFLSSTAISEMGLSKYVNEAQSMPSLDLLNTDSDLFINSGNLGNETLCNQEVDQDLSINPIQFNDFASLPNNKSLVINNGSWVLVEYKIKQKCKHYVGQVIDAKETEFTVTFLRHVKDTYFTWPTKSDVDTISLNFIKEVLSEPLMNRRAQVIFENLKNTHYNLE